MILTGDSRHAASRPTRADVTQAFWPRRRNTRPPCAAPENVCFRLLSLLQSVPLEPISVKIHVGKKARFRAVLRARLGVPNPERYANSLSERRTLSGAWGLADLVYKLFPERLQ
jgi:hypothetical protein